MKKSKNIQKLLKNKKFDFNEEIFGIPKGTNENFNLLYNEDTTKDLDKIEQTLGRTLDDVKTIMNLNMKSIFMQFELVSNFSKQ